MKDEFENWAGNVRTKSKVITFFPKTKKGICNIVKWAKSANHKVRAAGFRHSYSNITIDNESQVLISMVPHNLTWSPPIFIPKTHPHNELQGIKLLNKTIKEDGIEKRLCKIGAGTTNEQFRAWVISNSLNKNREWEPWWSLPFNTIIVEITFGGSNAPICHGAGKKTTTLSDLVASIEFVNSMGELQTVDDPFQLRSVSGCFGMLGVVTSITMKLNPQTFARMMPMKKRLALTIPPPKGFQIPEAVDMSGIKSLMLEQAFEEFKSSCEQDYYVEYLWFPNQTKCWINNWKNDGNASDAKQYPGPILTEVQELVTKFGDIMTCILPRRFQMNFHGICSMLFYLPERNKSNPIVTPVSEAIHFTRGIHNMHAYTMEWEIPIPGLKSDPSKPDWTVCQKAWWVVIKSFYDRFEKDRNDLPMRLPLEMRITGGSEVNMAPQYGNGTHGTCSIGIVTPCTVDEDEWLDYMQEITDLWTNLTTEDGYPIHPFENENGQLLHVRPHWAKYWEGINVHGKPIKQYLREEAFKDQILLFREGLAGAATAGGYTLEDAAKVFSTKFSSEMFGMHPNDTHPKEAPFATTETIILDVEV
eukprot:CAMPEP_0195308760 /NCGR_PEP_ID=MMETSP0707-20130614/38395_1 /TAXON_ID=33640 /ORGANISM="Asterionellopsis glacialis, Strain CCMP134" /LENGTH=587 /DNA_ID=CAMNT_0040373047 /DNA_START=157 /DNA_END=1920 /DNA_ORIENTATION=+